jgi:hypothetical protein
MPLDTHRTPECYQCGRLTYRTGHYYICIQCGGRKKRIMNPNLARTPMLTRLPVPLRCPFCGTLPKVRQAQFFSSGCWVVECRSNRCGINPQTTPCDNRGVERGKHGAILAWNSRGNDQGQAIRTGSATPPTLKPQ